MNSVRVVYHLALADFLERIRRYSFLIMLGLAAFLAYQVSIGNLALRLGKYRGEFNSAWVGAMITLKSSQTHAGPGIHLGATVHPGGGGKLA